MVGEDTMSSNDAQPNLARRRQQHQQHIPHIRRILRGQPPPRSVLAVNRPVNRNNGVGTNSNIDRISNENLNVVQNNPLSGDMNGSPNRNRNRNVQHLRFNIGGRGPFMMRQQQQPATPFNRATPDQQQQQQQEQPQLQQTTNFHPMGPNGPIQMGPNGPVHMGPNGPVPVRMVQVQVDHLTPQLLSASPATSTNNEAIANMRGDSAISNRRMEDPPELERYKCEICYEYINDPVGCGKCASRFCRTCLQKVYDSDIQKQQTTKCPVCRCEYSEMVPDPSFYGGDKGGTMPTLPCRHVSLGCPERNLPLSQIAQHEQVCPHVPMRCRYAPYGCRWVGKRGLVQAHEEFGCKLAPIGKFIEQFRQTRADHAFRLEMISQQATGAIRMSHVLRQTYTRDNQRKSLSDSFRLIQYCHAATSLTPHFFMTKDLWVSYWRNNESRAAVINFCICVPLMAAAFGVVGHGARSLFEFFEDVSPGKTLVMLAKAIEGGNMDITNNSNDTTPIARVIKKLQQSQNEELLIDVFLAMCVGALGIMMAMLNYVETKSNISWNKISLPYFGGRYPLVGDVMSVSIFALLFSIMEYHQSNLKVAVFWIAIVLSSTFFPALMFALSHYTARLVTRTPRPATFNLMEMARLVEPCMFGLRFSMTLVSFGVMATLDSAIVLCLVPRKSQLHLKNTLFERIPTEAFFVYIGVRCGNWIFKMQELVFGGNLDLSLLQNAVTIESAQKFFSSSPEAVALSHLLDEISISVVATASLMITCFGINTLFALGITVGDYIAHTSQVELSPEGIARGTAKEYSSVGLLAFVSWAMMVAFVARI